MPGAAAGVALADVAVGAGKQSTLSFIFLTSTSIVI